MERQEPSLEKLRWDYLAVKAKWESKGVTIADLPPLKTEIKPKHNNMKNKITDLRNHLFEQLEKLSDEGIDLDKEIKRTESMIGIAKTLIETGRAETEFLKTVAEFGKSDSEFFDTTRAVGGLNGKTVARTELDAHS